MPTGATHHHNPGRPKGQKGAHLNQPMPLYHVYKEALVTYQWHEIIEADSAADAIEQVEEKVDALLDQNIDPYGSEQDGKPFYEVDWANSEWDVLPVEEGIDHDY